ncbi:MFS transporter [Novosphingobium mangrovi (ex Huang et al. 2023)]|uniref:MFS transporter n=1 Tax=Novosphingobium mangrovi (ex Huang et al. 2023) TaxID=2976432 RepID=A0ABT2I3U7_9SPHN|nr:MFS transporter [Novosphingobium mangrovi (ex Huang et al. 2023)]MCT2399473.1 MFS transporter [Novosphingobium mangrovi (ex Huang et al. 2023)]
MHNVAYFREFRVNWPMLLGAMLGLALGSALNHYMTNLFAPALIAEFGWDKAQFALVGTLGLASMVVVPFWGRFTDRYGARIAAGTGFAVVPLTFFAFSLMRGDIYEFFAITVVQHLFGVLTTTLVFSRVIVQRFDLARGMALSVLMSGAPLVGAAVVPLVGEVIEAEGWRAAYRLLALLSAIGGIVAVTLVGRRPRTGSATDEPAEHKARAIGRAEFVAILRHPSFLLIVAGMFFCNVPQVIVSSQLKLVLIESGAASQLATWIVSLYAVGVVVGRFLSGIALDRISPQIVALAALGLPAIGFMILASPAEQGWLLAAAVLLVGLAQGAEGDIGAYLTSRTFDLTHFSLIYSFLIASMGLATAFGSIVLSMTLGATARFDMFLIIAAALTIVGALCFFMTGRGDQPPRLEPDAQRIAPAI